MATTASKLLETARHTVKGECSHEFPYEGPMCPCCAELVPVNGGTTNIRLLHAQRVFFCGEPCKSRFLADPSSYLAIEGERISQQATQTPWKRAQGEWLSAKDLELFQVWCPGCNTSLHVDNATPRLHLLNGQTLFFRCYECVIDFLQDPMRFMAVPQGEQEKIREEEKALSSVHPSEVSKSDQVHPSEVSKTAVQGGPCKGGKLSGKEAGEMTRPGEVCPEHFREQSRGQETHLARGQETHLGRGPATPLSQGRHLGRQEEEQKHEGGGIMEGISGMFGAGTSSKQCEEKFRARHHHSYKPTEKRDQFREESLPSCPTCARALKNWTMTDTWMEFIGGQRILFCSEACMAGFNEDPIRWLKPAKEFRSNQPESMNMEGFVLLCPTCEGRKLVVTTATPRIFFNHGQCLFFDKHDCIETFCAGASKYLHTCPRVKRESRGLEESQQQQYQQYQKVPVKETEMKTQKVPVVENVPVVKYQETQVPYTHTSEQQVPVQQGAYATGYAQAHQMPAHGYSEKQQYTPHGVSEGERMQSQQYGAVHESSPPEKEGLLSKIGTKLGLTSQPELPAHQAPGTHR